MLNSAELYDPASDTFVNMPAMGQAGQMHGAALLPDGSILAVGGSNNLQSGGALKSAEVFFSSIDLTPDIAVAVDQSPTDIPTSSPGVRNINEEDTVMSVALKFGDLQTIDFKTLLGDA